jgi:ABC-type molybdenum transport system ATPase subunit/photorepair protein PhrA
MMVLDEPAASMDDNRAMSLLTFIAAANFDQVILITHEDVSESFAANLIQL